MTRGFNVTGGGPEGYLLDLTVDGDIVATLPYRSGVDADEFGREFVARDSERQRSREAHPAGKRLAE